MTDSVKTDPRFANPVAQQLGFPRPELVGDRMVATFVPRHEHTNSAGMIHGGILLTLADDVASYAAKVANQDENGEGPRMVTLGLNSSMLGNQRGGEVRIESTIVRAGRRVTVVRTEIRGDGGKLLSEISSTHLPA